MVNTSTIINKNVNRSSPQLTQTNIMTYGVDNPGPRLEQKHTCVLIIYTANVSHSTFDSLFSYLSKSKSSKIECIGYHPVIYLNPNLAIHTYSERRTNYPAPHF